MSVNTKLAAQALSPVQAKVAAKAEPAETLADRMSVGFEDLLDVVNPLQQLPVVSSVYREATGDSISIPARLAGGFLFGGPAGLIGSAAMALFEEVTGDSVLGHLESLVDEIGGEETPPGAGTATANTALPWMKEDGDVSHAALPSAASMAEALKRKTVAVHEAEVAATLRPEERPAPQLLAKLYSLQATEADGAHRL
ncbi:hypothetical protein [Azospirillum doebereinerae]|uniref:Uncharacterized protein n=1 Tax=Azospirillum doebereinerae TaxID=92933 RepID=A0A3S0XLH5_9PROT|nr:hypothetical protein [Azospirillum doebereinerae]RUQ68425.1 hypothetical protein EJ913_17475 [Azospirillum doebereinerae]